MEAMNAGKEDGVENAVNLDTVAPDSPVAPVVAEPEAHQASLPPVAAPDDTLGPAEAPETRAPVAFPAMANAANVAAVIQPDQNSLEEERAFEKEVRSEIKRLVIYALRLGAAVLGVMLVVRFWHLAAPSSWRWLSDPEVQSMDKMLFSSAFGGFVFSYLKDSVFKKK